MVEPLQVWLWLIYLFISIHALSLDVHLFLSHMGQGSLGQLCAAALCQGQGQIKDQSKKGWLIKTQRSVRLHSHRRLQNSPAKPKRAVERVNMDHLVEAPICEVFNSHCWKNLVRIVV